MTTFTKTPPTEPGKYYWKIFLDHSDYDVLDVFKEDGRLFVADADGDISVRELGGFWGGRVPAPGTTWTIPEIATWACDHNPDQINDPQSGIAATTARHRKEQG